MAATGTDRTTLLARAQGLVADLDGDAYDLRALAEDLGDRDLDIAVSMLLSAIDWVGDRLDTLEEMAAAATPHDTASGS